jgi:hypothetical protein
VSALKREVTDFRRRVRELTDRNRAVDTRRTMADAVPERHHHIRGHVVVVGRSPVKMRQALQVLESAGFAATGTFNRDEAMVAITAQHRLFAVVVGGSVDREAEAELRAAAEAKGGRVVRANIGDSDPTQHFIDYVLPQLERPRSTAT